MRQLKSLSLFWFLIGFFLFSFLLKVFFIYVLDGLSNFEVTKYLLESLEPTPESIYLGVPSYGGGWRIPSFLFFPFNHLMIEWFGYIGLVSFVALINSLGLVLTFFILRELFVQRNWATDYTILWSLMVASLIPMSIFIFTSIWNPAFIFPLSMASLYCLILWVKVNKARYLIYSSLFLFLLVQYHLIGYFLLPIIGIAFLIYRPSSARSLLAWMLVILPWLFLFGGYWYFENLYDYPNLEIMESNPMGKSKEGTPWFQNFAAFFFVLKTSTTMQLILFEEFSKDFTYQYFIDERLANVGAGLQVVYLFSALFFWGKKLFVEIKAASLKKFIFQKKALFIVLLWVFFPILIFFIIGKTYLTRYAIIIYSLAVALGVFFYFELKNYSTWFYRLNKFLAWFNLIFLFYFVIALGSYAYHNIYNSSVTTSNMVYQQLVSIKDELKSEVPAHRFFQVVKEDFSFYNEETQREGEALINWLNQYNQKSFCQHNDCSNYKNISVTNFFTLYYEPENYETENALFVKKSFPPYFLPYDEKKFKNFKEISSYRKVRLLKKNN